MRGSLFVLFALFSNFFGSYLVSAYTKYIGIEEQTAFTPTGYEFGAILDCSVIFIIISSAYFFMASQLRTKPQRALSYHYKIDGYFYLLTVLVFIFGIVSFLSVNWSFSVVNRGAGQFERNIFDSLARILILSFPLAIFYVNAYWRNLLARFMILFLIAGVTLSDVSNGDRRMLFSYVVLLIFLIFRRGQARGILLFFASRKGIYLFSILSLLILSYAIRAEGSSKMEYLSYGLLNGTLGGLGIGKILAQVKYYVVEETGYLMGETFVNYIVGLFVPSFLLYLIGSNEFYLRSSYMFDELFNNNKNMGYDFMMVADFYWNFSYIGYLLYTVFSVFILKYIIQNEQNTNDFKFGLAVLLAAFFIAGQRSDLGFFLKSFSYCALTLWLLHKFAPKRVKLIS